MLEFENQGVKKMLPDYRTALQTDIDLKLAIVKVNELFNERGVRPKDLEQTLKTLETVASEEMLISSREGEVIAEDPTDKLKKVAQADIFCELTYEVKQTGPRKQLTYILRALDPYTNQQIASSSDAGNPSLASGVPDLIEEAVVKNMDGFTGLLQDYFSDVLEKGREISVSVKRWDDCPYYFDDYFDLQGEEFQLDEIIEFWIEDNIKSGAPTFSIRTRNQLTIEQVKIPLFETRRGKERPLDARRFIGKLERYLREKYGIESKINTRGLGQAELILGGK